MSMILISPNLLKGKVALVSTFPMRYSALNSFLMAGHVIIVAENGTGSYNALVLVISKESIGIKYYP